MLELLEKLTGFSKTDFGFPDVVHEFNAKFGNTLMFLNDELVEITDITIINSVTPDNCILRTTQGNYAPDKIQSLKPFRPHIGIHILDDSNFLVINKTAKKVYKKSFSWGDNYTLKHYDYTKGYELPIDSSLEICKKIVAPSLKKYQGYLSKNNQIYLIQGNIFFLEQLIGTYTHGTRETSNYIFKVIDTFSQELEDLLNKEFN